MGIIVVGLGPGNGRYLTREAWGILSQAKTVYLRTQRHPAVDDLPASVQRISFDEIYDTAESFESVYEQIVTRLLKLGRDEDVVYAVPGHPFVGESTVTKLVSAAETADVSVQVIAGLSFVEPMLTAVAVDVLDGLQIFDALDITQYQYPPINADVPLLLGQVYSRLIASEAKLLLTAVYPDEHPVILVHAAGSETQQVEHVPLYAIDRSEQIDHLTSLYVPPLPYKADLQALAETVAILRSPDGCPWDQEQTPQSMRSGFLEEASEVLEALDNDDTVGLQEELGDMFYHLIMQVQMAAEVEDFKLTDVIAGIEAKLKHRHPHVWGDWEVADTDEVLRNWEMIKKDEKNGNGDIRDSVLDGIPLTMPALARSQKIQDKVRKVGFDWPDIDGVYAKLHEEIDEVKAAQTPAERLDELGDLLFVVVNLASWLGVEAESALREANNKFSRRFRASEQLIADRQLDMSQMDIAALEAIWQEVKRRLQASG